MGKGMRAGKKKKVGGGAGNMQQQMKQLQAMQRDMEAAQASIAEQETTATAGGGAVEVTVNGNKEITKLVIDRDVVDPDDVELLQDLVLMATNDALTQAEKANDQTMGQFTKGLNIPGF